MSVLVMLTHFISKKNTLKFVKPLRILNSFKMISVNGFSSFIVDVAMGIATMLFNRRVMEYLGTDALAVYGVIVVVGTLVQCCSYGIGQAAQPVISRNFGAGLTDRIKTMLKYNIITAAVFGAIWTVLSMAMPQVFIKLFMTPTPEVLSIAPGIIRIYAISFVLLPFNIYSTYYFQAIMRSQDITYRIRCKRYCNKRCSDTFIAYCFRRKCSLVGNAYNRSRCICVFGCYDEKSEAVKIVFCCRAKTESLQKQSKGCMLILIFTEKRSFRLTVDEALSRLQKSAFRAKFHLSDEDINYIDKKGLDTVKSHAEDFIKKRLAPAVIPNDGKQTPMRGHPVI